MVFLGGAVLAHLMRDRDSVRIFKRESHQRKDRSAENYHQYFSIHKFSGLLDYETRMGRERHGTLYAKVGNQQITSIKNILCAFIYLLFYLY